MTALVLAGATSGSTTVQPTDAVTATLTLPSSTGTLLAGSTSQLCQAWVQFSYSSGVTINGQYNVSSVTRTSTGQYTINFTNAFVDANYVWSGNVLNGSGNALILGNWSSNTNTASAAQITAFNYNATNFDCTVGVAFFR